MKREKPPRSYRAVIESLAQVWRIERVVPEESIWQLGTPGSEMLPRKKMRLAIWNLCKGAGGRFFENDFRHLCFRSDIILAQEALLSKKSLPLFCEPGFGVVHAASYMRRDRLRDGVMTVSRVSADCDRLHRIVCKYPEPILKTPKVALVTFYPIADSEAQLMVVNVHATLIRRKSAAVEEMEHLVHYLPKHDGPMIFAGDFNTFTSGYLRAISSVLRELQLEYVPIPNDPRSSMQALDQVFCRGLEVETIEVDTTIKNSDHFPLLLHVSYTGF